MAHKLIRSDLQMFKEWLGSYCGTCGSKFNDKEAKSGRRLKCDKCHSSDTHRRTALRNAEMRQFRNVGC